MALADRGHLCLERLIMAADGVCDVMSKVELSANQLVFRAADIAASCLGSVQYSSARLLTKGMTFVRTAFTDVRA